MTVEKFETVDELPDGLTFPRATRASRWDGLYDALAKMQPGQLVLAMTPDEDTDRTSSQRSSLVRGAIQNTSKRHGLPPQRRWSVRTANDGSIWVERRPDATEDDR